MRAMHKYLFITVTLVAAGVLLFVVLFPHTPTPIAVTIGKLLVAAVHVVMAAIGGLAALVLVREFVYLAAPSLYLPPNLEIIDMICVRLR